MLDSLFNLYYRSRRSLTLPLRQKTFIFVINVHIFFYGLIKFSLDKACPIKGSRKKEKKKKKEKKQITYCHRNTTPEKNWWKHRSTRSTSKPEMKLILPMIFCADCHLIFKRNILFISAFSRSREPRRNVFNSLVRTAMKETRKDMRVWVQGCRAAWLLYELDNMDKSNPLHGKSTLIPLNYFKIKIGIIQVAQTGALISLCQEMIPLQIANWLKMRV